MKTCSDSIIHQTFSNGKLLSKTAPLFIIILSQCLISCAQNVFIHFSFLPSPCPRALRPPGWLPQWHCGVRVSSNKKLVGFISAIPADIRIYDTWAATTDHMHESERTSPSVFKSSYFSLCCSRLKRMVEINFLCVHKKLRSKRVAPVLIREITRRVNLEGIFQAVYTAGVVLPKPVSTCRYAVQ